MSTPLKVLCLDIEGGHGGSSRSLRAVLSHIDRARIEPEVWCRRAGPIEHAYAELGIPCRVEATLPKVSSLPKLSRNLWTYGLFLRDWLKSAEVRRRLLARAAEVDLVHLNHEGFAVLGAWLKRRTATPVTLHVRTNLWDTPFARWQTGLMARMDGRVFITANEVRTYQSLGGSGPGRVIVNVADPPATLPEPHPAVPQDDRFRIACLSNYSWLRGLDRLVDTAVELARRGRRDVLFVMAGDMRLSGSLPGRLGKLGAKGGTLADYAAESGVADMMLFLGHVHDPERVLSACHVLAKPTREDNPWGRDVIEALAAGRPVLTVGQCADFVEDGVTGVLQTTFDAEELADHILGLADDRAVVAAMGAAGRDRVGRLCNGPARAAELMEFWEKVAAR